MGRKPHPTELRKLKGNPSKRPLPENEPKPALGAEPPTPPAWLDEVGVGEWNRLSRQLWLNGILGLEDWTAFAGYCQAFSDWMLYDGMLAEAKANAARRLKLDAAAGMAEPSDPSAPFAGHAMIGSAGRVVPSAIVQLRNHARRDCLKFAAEFGLSPSSRSRVNVPRGLPAAATTEAKGDKPRPADFLNRGPRDNVVPLKA